MSFMIIDSEGNGGDFATNLGMTDLLNTAGPALRKLLEGDEADTSSCAAIVEEVKTVPAQAYIAELIGKLKPPVWISDGVS